MNKRQRKKQKQGQNDREWQEYFDSLKKLPVWYWKRGIHDAEILDVWERETGFDKTRGKRYRTCLVLSLDSSGAIYETDIKKIIFYNYEVKVSNAPISQLLPKTWWMGDTIEQLSNGNYLLNFEVSLENNDRLNFSMEFEYADVERQ